MSTGSGPHASSWRTPPPPTAGPSAPLPAWQAAPPRPPYRPRWRKLALAATGGIAALAAVMWAALWIRPPSPARLIVFQAGYDANLAVPPNPYGKAAARELAFFAKPGSWYGGQSRFRGTPEPQRLTRPGPQTLFPNLDAGRERCIVIVLAAHGGRDRNGAFLFPDDADIDPAHRLRITAILDRLKQLPANRQKLLILDATQCPAFPDMGLVHNDFAAGLEELNDAIAAVPNLVVFASSGPDQRSWGCPDWGTTAFAHFLHTGLNGAADADGDRRVNAWELIQYAGPKTHDWARDHRAALQTPLVLPRGKEAERRAHTMHLAMVPETVAPVAAPVPFEPPPEVRQAWDEYRELAHGTPPPQAYTPHLWREYEEWLLRLERHTLAGDGDGLRTARAKAAGLRRRIEDDRRLSVRAQTLALPVGVGAIPYIGKVPEAFAAGIARVANPDAAFSPAARLKEWDAVRASAVAASPEAARLLWGRALVEYVAADPVPRLPIVPAVLPLIGSGFDLRPAELNFLAVLAERLPRPEKTTPIGPLVKRLLTLRLTAERAAACLPERAAYPYAEFCLPWIRDDIRKGDTARRQAEDLCFSTAEADWEKAAGFAADAERHYAQAMTQAERVRIRVAAYHTAAARVPDLEEWLVRDVEQRTAANRLARELVFRTDLTVWDRIHAAAASVRAPVADAPAFDPLGDNLRGRVRAFDSRFTQEAEELIASRPEFEGRSTARAVAVRWWHAADALLTAPPPIDFDPARRVDLLRESRRVTRQLLVLSETKPEPLPEVSAEETRERAFDTARRRGQLLLARIGAADFARIAARIPGESFAQVEFRISESGFPVDGRLSLAEAGSRIGEVLAALSNPAAGTPPAEADHLIRLAVAPATADAAGNPALAFRRAGIRAVLLAQAQRTRADHWYGPTGEPYYRSAIDLLAGDARRLAPQPPAAPDDFVALRTAEEPFPIQPTAPNRVTITDEPAPTVAIVLKRQDGISVPPGFPVFSTVTQWGTSPVPAAPPAWEPVPLAADSPPAHLVRPIARPTGPPATTPAPRAGTMRVNGFFRGRLFTFTPELLAYDVPNQAAVTTPPADPYAKLALRADPTLAAKYGIGAGSVAIVLDCSGSMRPNPDVRGNRGLYPVAVDALRDILTVLPPGTEVSVRTFGRRTPGAESADDTIRVLVPPTKLPIDRTPVLAEIAAQAAAIPVSDLYEQSPVVRAVLDAKAALRTAPGPFKAVVLISDCVDNRFVHDPRYAKTKRSIGDVLRTEFTDSGIPLSVVALPVTDPVEIAAQGGFKIVEKLRPAGRFVPPPKAKELGVWLRTGLNPRVRYTVDARESDSPVTPFDLTATTEPPDEWYAGMLPRGRYRVKLAGAADFRREVFLGTGDRLLLDLTENGDRLTLKRHWYAATCPAVARAGTDEDGWKLALLQNRREAGLVKMLATIEGKPAEPSLVSVSRIGDVWFEVNPAVPRPNPVAVRWHAVQGFPAPTWAVDVAGWPMVPGGTGSAAPLVSAWWNANAPFPRTGEPWKPSLSAKLLDTQAVPLPGTEATIEAVTIETHSVEVLPGVRVKRPCLVVRLTHAAGKSVWVRPTGDTPPAGSEVRVYRDANRTTCLYWWDRPTLTAEDVAARVAGFDVVTLAAAKTGPHLDLKTVPAPSDTAPPVVPPAGGR